MAIGDHRLDQLEVGDRLAELLALGGIGDAVGDQPLGDADADRGDVQPAAVEHLHGDLEALAFLAEPVRGRHRHVVEIDVADMGALLAHLLFGLADADARAGRRAPGRRRRPARPRPPVRAITVKSDALSALVMKRLVPLST